jgi:hypothetical protein
MKLILITLVGLLVGLMVACSSEPAKPSATPQPTGPMYSEEEAIGVLKEHLQNKPVPIPGYPSQISCFSYNGGASGTWSAKYDNEGHRWGISLDGELGWLVYERTKSIVAIDNRLC